MKTKRLSNSRELIDIELAEKSPRPVFLTSPSLESLFALAALIDPSHHPFAAAWVPDVEAALSPEEQADLRLLRQMPRVVAFDALLWQHRAFADPSRMADAIRRESPESVAYQLCDEVLSPEEIRACLQAPEDSAHKVAAQHPYLYRGKVEAFRVLFSDPCAIRDGYARLLPRIWEVGVQPRLPELAPLWAATLEGLRQESEHKTPRELATEIFSRPFARRYGPGHEFETIYFIPSYFASPHRITLFDETTCVAVADCRLGPYALQQLRDDLAREWNAITDPTRLEILRLCALNRQYGQSLALGLKLKPATITHHLEILRQVGLLEDETEGAIRYHRTRPERVTELFKQLEDYLYNRL